MIYVNRGPLPAVLRLNEAAWREELCEARRAWYAGGKIGTKPDAPSSRYGHEEIRNALHTMFGSKCAYCEERGRRARVEHFRPRAIYPYLAYSWENLLPVCSPCNEAKGSWFPIAPHGKTMTENQREPGARRSTDRAFLIDPTTEDPSAHFTFRDEFLICRGRRSRRMCNRLRLNHEDLNDARREHLVLVRETIDRRREAMNRHDHAETHRIEGVLHNCCLPLARFAGMVRAELHRQGIDWATLP